MRLARGAFIADFGLVFDLSNTKERKQEKAHIQKNTQSTNIIIQQGLIECNRNT